MHKLRLGKFVDPTVRDPANNKNKSEVCGGGTIKKYVWSRRIRRMEERRDTGQRTNSVDDREEDS
jgi:hypothetical protein